MSLIILLIFVFALSILVLAFFNLKLGVALYVAYLILVPFLEFKVAGLPLSYNLVNLVLLMSFLYQFTVAHKKKIDLKIISPFLFLFFSLFILSFFEFTTPWFIQFNALRISFMQTCIVTLIIWNIAKTDFRILTYIKWALIFSFLIAGIYGLFLMKLNGINPYTSYLSKFFNKATDAAEIYSSHGSRLSFSTASKIQSTFRHPMLWALNLSFMIIIVISFTLKEKKFWWLIALLGFNLLISGVRTGIAALLIGGIYYFIMRKNFKVFLFGVAFSLVGYLAASSNEDVSNMFASFIDFSGNKSEINGSSITMRLDQFDGALNSIRGNELVGNGYNWTGYYMETKGDHPVLLAFESLIFVVVCNGGIIGIVIWSVFFFLLFKLNQTYLKAREDTILMNTFVFTYLAYSIGTGEYGYIQVFAVFYTFLLSSLIYKKQIN